IHRLPTRQVATELGILPQQPIAPEGISVADLVARGRHPHQRWLRQWSVTDEQAVEVALQATGMADLADRPVDELSGGQRQRAWIALALAQGTDVMLLDEPTTFLDLAHQIEVLDLLHDLNRRDQRTIVLVLHDLNLACRYADHLVAMKDGRIVAEGPPREVMTPEVVEDVFGLACRVIDDPLTATPMVVPVPNGRRVDQAGAPASAPDPALADGHRWAAGAGRGSGPAQVPGRRAAQAPSRSELRQDVLDRADLEARAGLDQQLLDDAVLEDGRVALRPGAEPEGAAVHLEPDLGGELAVAVGEHQHLALGALGLAPGADRQSVVQGKQAG